MDPAALAGPSPGSRLGSYVIEDVLGRGGMGVVYRARSDADGRVVAIKLLRPELSGNALFERRFSREARVAESLRHRNLVAMLETGETDGIHYIVSDYVSGQSLRERLHAAGPLDPAEARRLAADLGRAIDVLHRAELVHRDVKPSNVLLDGSGTAFLTDFGLATGPAFTVLTKPGELMGTPAYLAPELISGKEATPRSDLYAMGCVLFESLTGRPPFSSTNMFEVVVGHLEEAPPSIAEFRDDLPAAVSDVLEQTLAKRPEDRPPTGRTIALLLAAALT